MSCPCYDAMDEPEPWSDDDTAWQGDVHASSDWEALEALAGPEYRFYKALAESRWELTPLGESARLQANWPETKTVGSWTFGRREKRGVRRR